MPPGPRLFERGFRGFLGPESPIADGVDMAPRVQSGLSIFCCCRREKRETGGLLCANVPARWCLQRACGFRV